MKLKCYVLGAMCWVLCALCYVLCSMFWVLGAGCWVQGIHANNICGTSGCYTIHTCRG